MDSLERYKDENAIPETQNPLTWWKLNTHRFPVLASFAKAVLCVPATSLLCERLFSSSGYIVNKTRAALLLENCHLTSLSARLAQTLKHEIIEMRTD